MKWDITEYMMIDAFVQLTNTVTQCRQNTQGILGQLFCRDRGQLNESLSFLRLKTILKVPDDLPIIGLLWFKESSWKENKSIFSRNKTLNGQTVDSFMLTQNIHMTTESKLLHYMGAAPIATTTKNVKTGTL